MPKKRTAPLLKLLPVLHIYCEGEKTEPNYIRKYIDTKFPGDRRRSLIRVEPTKKNTPVQLVDVAVDHKKNGECPCDDVFWVVYDRESVAKYSDELHLKAYQKAKNNGIHLAISNVCFELWLYLHFQGNTAPYSSYSDFISRSKFKVHLASVGIKNYEKGDKSFFDAININHINSARSQAFAMNKNTLACAKVGQNMPHQLNPYTDMHLLLRALDTF